MRNQTAKVGARGTDSVTVITADAAKRLKASGIDFCVRYLGNVTAEELAGILAAGLAFMPVTYANMFDGALAVARCKALGLPLGTTVWLDVEGDSVWRTDPVALSGKINGWAAAVTAAGYVPGLYVGAPQPLTSAELGALGVVRYWHGQGRCVDHTGALAEPPAGWCMWQMWPSVTWEGVNVDVNIIGEDYKTRLPAWVVSALAAADGNEIPPPPSTVPDVGG